MLTAHAGGGSKHVAQEHTRVVYSCLFFDDQGETEEYSREISDFDPAWLQSAKGWDVGDAGEGRPGPVTPET